MKTAEEIAEQAYPLIDGMKHEQMLSILDARKNLQLIIESELKEHAINFAEHYHTSISSYAKSQKPTEYYYDKWTNPNQL